MSGTDYPPPPFDAESIAELAKLGPSVTPFLTPEMIHDSRAAQVVATDAEIRRDGRIRFEERTVPGPSDSPPISLLICRPASASGLTPAIYMTHGGGMVSGNNRSDIEEALDWVEELNVTLISVEYRLAPETPHPGPIEDCYAGLIWVSSHYEELMIDPDRIVVAGFSAGGGLAAALSLLARDRGGPVISGQLLLCPMLDDRNDTLSSHQMAGRGIWDRVANDTGWTALLGNERGSDTVSPYAAPARATDLSRLPPAFIDVGSAETFRDEDIDYASRIWAAGGEAELHVWPGGFHGYYVFAPKARISVETREARIRWLRRHFGGAA